jgi:hypothetical protein
MHENQILVLTKQPGKSADLEPLFCNKLEAFQEFVGGYIETFTLQNDMVVICNEEGRLLDMKHNVVINGVAFVGPVIIAGVKGDEFSSIKAHLVPKAWKLLEEGGSL